MSFETRRAVALVKKVFRKLLTSYFVVLCLVLLLNCVPLHTIAQLQPSIGGRSTGHSSSTVVPQSYVAETLYWKQKLNHDLAALTIGLDMHSPNPHSSSTKTVVSERASEGKEGPGLGAVVRAYLSKSRGQHAGTSLSPHIYMHIYIYIYIYMSFCLSVFLSLCISRTNVFSDLQTQAQYLCFPTSTLFRKCVWRWYRLLLPPFAGIYARYSHSS